MDIIRIVKTILAVVAVAGAVTEDLADVGEVGREGGQITHHRLLVADVGQVAAVDSASRIAMLCGGTLAEGWACYATDLAEEFGFLTPAESFGQHAARLRMAWASRSWADRR